MPDNSQNYPTETPKQPISPEQLEALSQTMVQSADQQQQAARMSERPHEVPGYTIFEELGRGGMGVVYRAVQLNLNRAVALKMMRTSVTNEAAFTRFRAEAHRLARLDHPGIVRIFDVGEVNGRPYYTMDYIPGGSLAQKLKAGPLPAEQAALVVEQLAQAVQAAHDRNIIHRDLKPANILLASGTTGLSVKITDFGLAKQLNSAGITQSQDILGTPSYMAPEQAAGQGKEATPAADIYALGAVFYECLTGQPPFRANSPYETINLVLRHPPRPPRSLNPDVPPELEAICLRCLAKEPSERYAKASQLADELRNYAEGRSLTALTPSLGSRLRRWLAKPARYHQAGGLSLALAIVFVLWPLMIEPNAAASTLAILAGGQGLLGSFALRGARWAVLTSLLLAGFAAGWCLSSSNSALVLVGLLQALIAVSHVFALPASGGKS